MKKIFFLLIPVLFFFIPDTHMFSEEKTDNVKSLTEIREEKLLYGLNNEILELISALTEEKNIDHNSTLKEIFSLTQNPQIKEQIIKLYTAVDSDDLLELTAEVVSSREYENRNLVISSIRYISDKGGNKYNTIFEDLLTDIIPEYRIESIKALCRTSNKKYTDLLIDKYNEEDETSVRLAILLDIGKLKDSSALNFLTEIIRDTEVDRTSRQYAINSLGEINDEKSLDDLINVFQDTDPLIRLYAVAAISRFDGRDVNRIILEALRDENWRIRNEAVVSSGKTGNNDFINILKYRADNDPVENIRVEAVKAIGNIGGREAFEYLRNKAKDQRISLKIRREAFIIIINKDLDQSLETVDFIINNEWTTPHRVIIETFCSELSKIESRKLDKYFEIMLDHSSISIRISGLRGIRLNRIQSLKDKVELLTTENNPVSIRNHALAVLDAL